MLSSLFPGVYAVTKGVTKGVTNRFHAALGTREHGSNGGEVLTVGHCACFHLSPRILQRRSLGTRDVWIYSGGE